MSERLGRHSTIAYCPNCGQHVRTFTSYEISLKTHLLALLLCLCGCWFCSCIPYCSTCAHDIAHYCTRCGMYLGNSSF